MSLVKLAQQVQLTMSRQSFDTLQAGAVARLFSSTVLREMACWGRSPLFCRLVTEAALREAILPEEPIHNLFEVAFRSLKRKDHRHEYIYKAAITHKILLGKHSLRTAAMLTEFRVGNCRADVVILNGTSTAYEIKSERDRLDRLQAQVSAYLRVFANVSVIAGENHVADVRAAVPREVGILFLTSKNQISIDREPIETVDRIMPELVFDALRMNEVRQILESQGVFPAVVPNTELHGELRKHFIQLNPDVIHSEMVRVLQKSRSLLPLDSLVRNLPPSLSAAAISIRLRRRDHSRLINAVNTPLRQAMAW